MPCSANKIVFGLSPGSFERLDDVTRRSLASSKSYVPLANLVIRVEVLRVSAPTNRETWCAVHVVALINDVQDSLLEITLRSRVIEKLSVALDVCLFQHEKDQCLATNAVDEVRVVSLLKRLRPLRACATISRNQH